MTDIFSYNGGSLVGMRGKDCVALAADNRLGQQYSTIATNFQRLYKVNDGVMMGLTGLATDVQTFAALMKQKVTLYELKQVKKIKASTFTKLVSTSLYEKRFGPFFTTPIVVGLDAEGDGSYKPVIANYDSIGCLSESDNFACAGTATDFLLGACESFYNQNLEAEDLFETIAQCFLAGINRDAFSGWGATVYVMTPGELIVKNIKTRQD